MWVLASDDRNRVRPLKARWHAAPPAKNELHSLLEIAGLRRGMFHGLRHSDESLMISKEAPSLEVMEALGNSAIAMTLNRYAHIIQEPRRDTAKNGRF